MSEPSEWRLRLPTGADLDVDIPVGVDPVVLFASRKWTDYVAALVPPYPTHVDVRDVKMFGERVGFIVMDATVHHDAVPVPGYIVLRGPAVGLLVEVNDCGLLVVEQLRAATGGRVTEMLAGMLDEEHNVTGVLIKEAEQEAGLTIAQADLVQLGDAAGNYTSAGLLDECVVLYGVALKITPARLAALAARTHGVRADGEVIRVHVIPNTWAAVAATRDLKLIAAFGLWSAK
jgi:ADP-sugar diphosphatase